MYAQSRSCLVKMWPNERKGNTAQTDPNGEES